MRILSMLCLLLTSFAAPDPPRFRALVLAEPGGHHIAYSKAARVWLDQLAADSGFAVDYLQNTAAITPAMLRQYRLFIQLDYPPYGWTDEAARALVRYVEEGQGGWIGFHHATLLGEFDGHAMWTWFSQFMGGIRFTGYIPGFADGQVVVEKTQHPVMRGMPDTFTVEREEWYTYDRSPRPQVEVLARVDESTYVPGSDKKMGDHPVVWSNPRMKARNVYIFMGHGPHLFQNEAYCTLFRNAVSWAAGGTP